jgi:hypothetical protein
VVALLLGVMALFLATLNRRLLIDTSDPELDKVASDYLVGQGLVADVTSIVLDDDRGIVFVHTRPGMGRTLHPEDTHALGEALKAYVRSHADKIVDDVYWKFPASPGA